MAFVANPRVTFNIITSENRVGPDDQRCLYIGQMGVGTAQAGLTLDIPRTDAEINALVGATSSAGMALRAYRDVNPYTNLDAILLADNASGTAATAVVTISGTATASGPLVFDIASRSRHRYSIDVLVGETGIAVATKLLAAVNLDRWMPFTAARADGAVTFTATNKGTLANDWPIAVVGAVPGIAVALTAWSGGSTNPSLTGIFDAIDTIRYQSIIWPSTWDPTPLKTLLDGRKNVDNNIMDGMGFTYRNKPFATLKTEAIASTSSEVVHLANEPVDRAAYKGPYVPEQPDVVTAKFVAALDLRVEPDVSISHVVATNAPNDQFGGPHTHSLPVFNTPILNVGIPLRDAGFSLAEQRELEESGVTVIGVNRTGNGVICGVGVTTWNNDVAGNLDNTWKYIEWRRTHGMIREYFQRNCQKEYRQHRLTAGTAVAGYAMVDEAAIRSFCGLLYQELTQIALTIAGQEARRYFENNLTVRLVPSSRQVQIAAKVPMMSQLGEIIGTIEYTFETV
jgi:phage tail sheath gpL-like